MASRPGSKSQSTPASLPRMSYSVLYRLQQVEVEVEELRKRARCSFKEPDDYRLLRSEQWTGRHTMSPQIQRVPIDTINLLRHDMQCLSMQMRSLEDNISRMTLQNRNQITIIREIPQKKSKSMKPDKKVHWWDGS